MQQQCVPERHGGRVDTGRERRELGRAWRALGCECFAPAMFAYAYVTYSHSFREASVWRAGPHGARGGRAWGESHDRLD